MKKRIIINIIVAIIYSLIITTLNFFGIKLGGIATLVLLLVIFGIINLIIRDKKSKDDNLSEKPAKEEPIRKEKSGDADFTSSDNDLNNETTNSPFEIDNRFNNHLFFYNQFAIKNIDSNTINNIISSYDGNSKEIKLSDVIVINSLISLKNNKVLTKNNYTICDTILFTIYFCKSYIKTFNYRQEHIDNFIKTVQEKSIKATSKYFYISENFVKMQYLKRGQFYKKLFDKFSYENIDSAIEEYILVIQYDYFNNKYVEFSFDSPLLLMEISDMTMIVNASKNYLKCIRSCAFYAISNYLNTDVKINITVDTDSSEDLQNITYESDDKVLPKTNDILNSINSTDVHAKTVNRYYKISTIFLSITTVMLLVVLIVVVLQNTNYKQICDEYEESLEDIKFELQESDTNYDDLQEHYYNLKSENSKLEDELEFYNEHAVCVNSDSKLYHTYGKCKFFDSSSFWIYNTEAAESMGYEPCPFCFD